MAGMKAISEAVAVTLKEMREYARIGMTTKELDEYGRTILEKFGAKSAPKLPMDFRDGPVSVSTMKLHMVYLQLQQS